MLMAPALDIKRLFESDCEPIDAEVIAKALAVYLRSRRNDLVACFTQETNIDGADAEESVDGCIAFLESFQSLPAPPAAVASAGDRTVEIHSAPWGNIVGIPPQNAFLYLSLVTLVTGLDCGNRVILRAPSGSRGTAEILAQALRSAGMDATQILVNVGAKDLLEAFYASSAPGLVHYFGGSGRIPDLASAAFRAGKGCIADGEGNTWAYVDEGYDARLAAETLTTGATRYNGYTCTSINGAIIHPSLYESVRDQARELFRSKQVGRLADPVVARQYSDLVNDYLAYAHEREDLILNDDHKGVLAVPTLIEQPDPRSYLVRQGLFGPVLWIAPGTGEDFRRLWPSNFYPLCAAILSPDPRAGEWTTLGNLARLVLNGDPSLEDPLEPWGGYPSSGNSRVSSWHEKYRRTVQVDRP